MDRVVLVCHDLQRVNELIARGSAIAKQVGASIVLLFIHDIKLFDFFDSEENFDKEKVLKKLQESVKEYDSNGVVLVKEGDSVDIIELELLRLKSSFVVVDYIKDITNRIVKALEVPAFVLKRYSSIYKKAFIATEIAKPKGCIDFVKKYTNNLYLYMDSLMIEMPYNGVATLDATSDIVDIELYEELIDEQKESFLKFCKEEGLECKYNTKKEDLAVNILSESSSMGADLLVIEAIDDKSILGSIKDFVLEKATVDLLFCGKIA